MRRTRFPLGLQVPLFLRMTDALSASAGKESPLTQTPTWAAALVCAFFIVVSVLLEKWLHKFGTWLWGKQKRALEALEKIKAELMILGFISLLLTFGERYLVKICIPENAAPTMWPCAAEESHRRLLWFDHRLLASDAALNYCKEIRDWKKWEQQTLSRDYDFSIGKLYFH